MRILQVLGTSAGGVGSHVHGLVRGLSRAGHHVVVAAPTGSGKTVVAEYGVEVARRAGGRVRRVAGMVGRS